MTADETSGTGGAQQSSNPARGAGENGPSLAAAVMRIFDLSLGQMLWSRRTIFMALVVAAPMVLAVLFRIVLFEQGGLAIADHTMKGDALFGAVIWLLYLRFIVPILGVFYGTSLIADEVDDKTITYLFVRPVPRRAILLGKYLAYVASTVLVVLPSVVVVYFLATPFDLRAIAGSFPALAKDLALLGTGLIVYGAVFAFVGTTLKHPLILGLVFAFGWEQLALLIPGYLRQFTVMYYLQSLVPHSMPQDSTLSVLQSVLRGAPSVTECLVWLVAIWAVFLVLAGLAIERREYVLEQ